MFPVGDKNRLNQENITGIENGLNPEQLSQLSTLFSSMSPNPDNSFFHCSLTYFPFLRLPPWDRRSHVTPEDTNLHSLSSPPGGNPLVGF